MKKKNKKNLLIVLLLIIVIGILVIYFMYPKLFRQVGTDISVVDESILSIDQGETDKKIKQELEKNGYELQNAKIYLDPYGVSPLSALILFKSNENLNIEVRVEGKNNNDLVTTRQSEIYNYIPVYGLYPDYENKVTVKLSSGEEKSFIIKTDSVPISEAKVNVSNIKDNNFYFITSPLAMSSFAIDQFGEIRWYTNSYYHNIVWLNNNHMLIGDDVFVDDVLTRNIYEMDLLGRKYAQYDINSGYLNDFYVKGNGNILLATKKPERNTYSDYIIEIDKNTGNIVKTTDVYNLLKNVDSSFVEKLGKNYFYISGINYNESEKTLLLTYWGGEFVINIDYEKDEIKWIFSNPENFSEAYKKYLLIGEDGFKYPKSMHSASLINDTLKVFDNGYSTNKDDSTISHLHGSYSSANTYKIDEMSISQISTIDEGQTLFSYALADYNVVENEELILFGRELNGVDYSSENTIHLYSDLSSRLLEMHDGIKVLDMTINKATYSVNKKDLTSGISFNFNKPRYLSIMETSGNAEADDDILKLIKQTTEKVDYNFGFNDNILTVNRIYMNEEEADIILLDENNKGYIYKLKVKNESMERSIRIDLTKGKYTIYVYENNIMYKTDKYIDIY